jgi:hypothetical protein
MVPLTLVTSLVDLQSRDIEVIDGMTTAINIWILDPQCGQIRD